MVVEPLTLHMHLDPTSAESLALARELAKSDPRCAFLEMDALELTFDESEFDKVVCVQNGICAFGVDQKLLLRQALRVMRRGGCVLVFWAHRLQWFEAQASLGLLGAIDYDKTGGGRIVCKDGFQTGQVSQEAFRALAAALGVDVTITEVDESSVFCEIAV